MSEMVHYGGKLTRIDRLPNETLEQQCKRILELRENCSYAELNNEYESYVDMLLDMYYQQYVIYNNDLYSVKRKSMDVHDDIFQMIPADYGFVFEVKYYNGGCSFIEAIDNAFRIMGKDNK